MFVCEFAGTREIEVCTFEYLALVCNIFEEGDEQKLSRQRKDAGCFQYLLFRLLPENVLVALQLLKLNRLNRELFKLGVLSPMSIANTNP